MSRKTVKIVSLIIAVVIALGLVGSIATYFVYATESTQEQINRKEREKREAQEKINAANQKREKSLAVMESLEQESAAIQTQIDKIDAKIAETDARLAEEEKKLAEATEKAESQYSVFKERFRVMCEQGDVSYIEILLTAKSFSDLIDRVEIVKEISEHDKAIFDEMEKNRLAIEKSRDEIAGLKKAQEENKSGLESEKSALAAKQREQKEYMAELERDTASYQKIIDQADAAMASLRRQASASLSTASSGKTYVGGEFAWPTPSCHYITSNFSPRRKNPVTGIYKRHTGTDIGAAYGTSIVAANSGTVTLAGWNSGYGNCVIIDHGGGRATLYAHMSSIGVSQGQNVQRGQQIGKVGSTGNSTGPHLHFEVLINGSAVDPMQFF